MMRFTVLKISTKNPVWNQYNQGEEKQMKKKNLNMKNKKEQT